MVQSRLHIVTPNNAQELSPNVILATAEEAYAKANQIQGGDVYIVFEQPDGNRFYVFYASPMDAGDDGLNAECCVDEVYNAIQNNNRAVCLKIIPHGAPIVVPLHVIPSAADHLIMMEEAEAPDHQIV